MRCKLVYGDLDRNGKAQAFELAGEAFEGVDAQHAAIGCDQRPPAVARVDLCVGLYEPPFKGGNCSMPVRQRSPGRMLRD